MHRGGTQSQRPPTRCSLSQTRDTQTLSRRGGRTPLHLSVAAVRYDMDRVDVPVVQQRGRDMRDTILLRIQYHDFESPIVIGYIF